MNYLEVFERTEVKYILTESTYKILFDKIRKHLKKDKYYESHICNIYFDTDNYDLIVNSINKPIYKEKVRLRSYQVPTKEDKVYLEVKKKYKSIVSKRKIEIKLKDFYEYYDNHIIPNYVNKQIMNELDYIFNIYNLKPKLYLYYDRHAYYDKDNINFRITFDENIRSREDDLKLEDGSKGVNYFKDKTCIMELKTLNALPMWMVRALNDIKIYPQSFSKYGSIYTRKVIGD